MQKEIVNGGHNKVNGVSEPLNSGLDFRLSNRFSKTNCKYALFSTKVGKATFIFIACFWNLRPGIEIFPKGLSRPF